MLNWGTGETNYPLLVKASEDDAFPGCGDDECKAWGTGILKVPKEGGRHSPALFILTAVGCEACKGPSSTNEDLRVKDHYEFEGPASEVVVDLRTRAEQALAQTVQELIDNTP